jgi:hypothetical protein
MRSALRNLMAWSKSRRLDARRKLSATDTDGTGSSQGSVSKVLQYYTTTFNLSDAFRAFCEVLFLAAIPGNTPGSASYAVAAKLDSLTAQHPEMVPSTSNLESLIDFSHVLSGKRSCTTNDYHDTVMFICCFLSHRSSIQFLW